MDQISKKLFYWVPALIWMGIIFYFSSLTRVSLSEEQALNFLIFKSFHVIEYAILYFLLFRTFFLSEKKRFSSKIYLYSFIIAVLYAASDEIHQLLIPTREGAIRDVFIDAIGITIMYTLIKSNTKIAKKMI